MKKFGRGILLVAGGMTVLLSGCGMASKKQEAPVMVTVWNYYNGAQKEKFDGLVQQFNDTVGQEENIIVEAVSKGAIDELVQNVKDSVDNKVGAEALPVICSSYADTAFELNEMGLLADMKPYLTQEEIDEYVDGYIDEGRFEAKDTLKIFPTAKSTEVLTLNLTAWEPFAEATGADFEDLSTWEGIAAVAESYYQWTDSQSEEPGDGKAFFGRDAFANYMLIGSRQLGHEIYRIEDGRPVLDFDKDTMRRLWDNYYVPFIQGHYLAEGKFRSDDLKTGSLIAYVGSTSGSPYTPEAVTYEDGTTYDITCKVLPLPNFEGTEPCAVQQGAGMVLFKSEEPVERAAVTFLKWFTSEEENLDFSAGAGYLPVKKKANDEAFLEKMIAEREMDISDVLKETLLVGIQEAQEYQMYTTKPFKNGNGARAVLNTTMADLAKSDREAVKALVASGMEEAEAVSQFSTEEHFEEWYEDTYQKLNSIN
ncbi:extracellular solute-binding protein [Clostridium sp. AN503]|uniref:extracellular solute-binding protein n=1 Tax=Clostridium sp. AN503 TaxID=3160598 RepID=UPI00345800DA